MRLQFHSYHVSNLRFGDSTSFQLGVLTLDKTALLEELANDERLSGVELEVVSPGTATRVSNVLDALEPRLKVDTGSYFPGMLSDITKAGSGVTNVLRGAAVLEVGNAPEFIGGLLDMSGPAAELSPLGRSHNLCVIGYPRTGVTATEYSQALKSASMKAAVYLAAATLDATPDEIETFDLDLPGSAPLCEGQGLPRVAYLLHVNSVGDLRQPFIYGDNPSRYYPTILHPNEVIDGAIVSGHYEVSAGFKNLTYALMNSPVVLELYRRHGKELDFGGVVVAPEPVSIPDIRRTAMMATGLLKDVLGAQGVIMTKETGGHTDVVLMASCEACEGAGVRTLLIDNEWLTADGTGGTPLIAFSEQADAMVSVGNIEAMIDLPAVEVVVGGDVSPEAEGDLHASLRVPIAAIANGISQVGLSHLTTERR